MKKFIKKIAEVCLPSYRVALRNELKLNNSQKELENTKNQLNSLKKQMNSNFTKIQEKLDVINGDVEGISFEEKEAILQKNEEKRKQNLKADEKFYFKEYDYKFSIIMTVNNDDFLVEEAINNIINQTIGFEKNVQLILVNYGTSYNNLKICSNYAKLYSNNIIFIHKESENISFARNSSLPYIRGKYVNFMEIDINLLLDTLLDIYIFFEGHYIETDIILTPFVFLDKTTNSLFTTEKQFDKGSRIVNLVNEYKFAITALSKCFIKSNYLENLVFDQDLVIGDDFKFLMQILLTKQTIGLFSNFKYLNAEDVPQTASIKDILFDKRYYLEFNDNFYKFLILNSLELLDEVSKFLQFNIMLHLRFIFKVNKIPNGVLNEFEIIEFKNSVKDILNYIEDKIIMETPEFYAEYKVFSLNLKYGKFADFICKNNDIQLYHSSTKILSMSNLFTRIDFITFNNDNLTFEGRMGYLNCTEKENIIVYANVNGKVYICENIYLNVNKYFLTDDDILFRYIGFKVCIPISENVEKYNINFHFIYRGKNVLKKEIRLAKFCPISNVFINSYYYKNKRVLILKDGEFELKKCGKRGKIAHEIDFLKELRIKQPNFFINYTYLRVVSQILRKLIKKEIWLISDRINRADDNGKAFFIYLQNKNLNKIKTYFIIDKDCEDYDVMKKIGRVIPYHSNKKLLFSLLATQIISSDGHDLVYHPYGEDLPIFKDLLQEYKYTFLQHGVIRDDLSQWLSKYHKNIKTFVTSSKYEYNSILDYDYYYSKNEVDLVGLPRYDLLYNDSKKYITIMPTWRKHLTESFDKKTRVWNLKSDFKTSDYFVFYNTLINDTNLLSKAKTLGYKIIFMPHPTITPHLNLFDKHNDVDFINFDKPYKEIYAESDLILTDYSSAVCDFSYLRKPIIYAHFDKERFFAGDHVYVPGYFDYEDMGFGEVEYDLCSTINRIIEYMENGCKLKDKYRNRIEDFFDFNDKNNCQRVFDAITKNS